MDTTNAAPNVATYALILMGLFVFLSLWTLFRYFFGERSPLERNALSRFDASLPPLQVLEEHRRHREQRFLMTLLLLGGLYIVLFYTAEEQTTEATRAFGQAVSITWQKAQEGVGSVLETLGIGSGCECD